MPSAIITALTGANGLQEHIAGESGKSSAPGGSVGTMLRRHFDMMMALVLWSPSPGLSGGPPVVDRRAGALFLCGATLSSMTGWLESAGVVLLSLLGAWLGLRSSRLRFPFWVIGHAVPLAVIVMVGATRHFAAPGFLPPSCWMIAGRREFALLALSLPVPFTTTLSRMRTDRERLLLSLFVLLIAGWGTLMPFLEPALLRAGFATMPWAGCGLDSNFSLPR